MKIAIILLIVASFVVSEDKAGCFNVEIPKEVNLLAGDVYAIDLDYHTKGNKISFDIQASTPESNHFVVETFQPNGADSELKGRVEVCTHFTHGQMDNEYVFLCDKTKLSFQTFNEANGRVESDQLIDIVTNAADREVDECHHVRTNSKRSKIYLLCSKKNNLYIYTVDPATKVAAGTPFLIEQNEKVPAQVLKTNLRILVDDYVYDGITDTLLYIYEEGSAKIKFRLAKDKKGTIISGGYYSIETDTILGIFDNPLVNFYYDNTRVMVVTKDKDNQNFLQRCLRSPIYSKYICEEKAILLEKSDGLIKFYHVDKNQHVTDNMYVYTATSDSLIVGLFMPESFTYVKLHTYSLKGSSLKKIFNVFGVGTNIFLVGPTQADKPLVSDGVVKISRKSQSFEEYNYPQAEAQVSFVREDFYNSHQADLILVGQGSTSFYKVKKNLLEINTRDYQEVQKSIKYTLKCSADEGLTDTVEFTVNTQVSVNDNPRLNLADLEFYYGAHSVYLPTNGDDISGNAPQLQNIKSTDPGVVLDFDFKLIDPKKTEIKFDLPKNLQSLKHIGENVFFYKDQTHVLFFKCVQNEQKVYVCGQVLRHMILEHGRFFEALVSENILYLLTGNEVIDPQATPGPVTFISAFSTEDGQSLFGPIEIKFATRLGELKYLGRELIVVVYGTPDKSSIEGLYYTKFPVDFKVAPKSFHLITSKKNHVCPTELDWTPRNENILYITSICDDSSRDNHVYEFLIDFEDMKKSEIIDTFVVLGSRQFNVCAQNRLINIIDMEQNRLYSFDAQTGQDSKYYLPIEEYNITSINAFTCDQDNNIIQIIGCGGEGAKRECSLVTYRGDLMDQPNKRVHSIVSIPEEDTTHLASTFNDINDKTFTVTMDREGKVFRLYRIELDGPHIKLNAEKLKAAGSVNLTWTIGYPGSKDTKEVTQTHQLTFIEQPLEVNVSLINPETKPVLDGKIVILEDFVYIQGPFHGIENSPSITYTDRLTPSQQFQDVQVVFEDSVFHKNFIFGTVLTGSILDIVLYEGTKKVLTIENKLVVSLEVIENSEGVYFFALHRVPLSKDVIRVVYSKDDGKTWQQASLALDSKGYKMVDIVPGPGSTFAFGGFNNLNQRTVTAFTFEVKGDIDIQPNSPFSKTFEDNIADFELVYTEKDNYVLIVAQEYDKVADFFWLSNVNGVFEQLGDFKSGLVPNFLETHVDISFKCRVVSSKLLCVNTGKNLYSYVSKYNLNFKAEDKNNFIDRVGVVTRFRNIVNLKPMRIDFDGDFVAIIVQNKAVLEDDQTPDHRSFFKERYMALVYKITSKVPAVEEGETEVRDVYKILSSVEFKTNQHGYLSRLDPRFFKGLDGNTKLGFNVGLEDHSIKVFNLDGLTLSANSQNSNGGNLALGFKSISSKVVKVSLKDFSIVKDEKKEDVNPKKGGNKLFLIILICAIVLIIAVVVVGVVMTKKDGENAEDLNIDDVEKTMKNPDESASGNYSKL